MNFNSNENSIQKIAQLKWDYIIIGTGIGGASFGLRMAQAGKRVLFLEKGVLPTVKGLFAEQHPNFQFEAKNVLKNAGRCSEPVQDLSSTKKKQFIPFIGSGVGGSSQLYGMVFERFSEREFHSVGNAWPVSYKTMQNYYQQAEQLFHVRQIKVASEANQKLIKNLEQNGLETYPLYMGKNSLDDMNCEGCQGFVCTCGKKADAYNSCIEKAVFQYGASLVTECEVVKLNANSKNVTSVLCRLTTLNEEVTFSSSNFVLAAGALFTPALLLKSKNQFHPYGLANSSGLVGKNLMRHLIDIYGLWTEKSPEKEIDLKEFGAKYFHFDQVDQRPKGVMQSFGRLPAVAVLLHEMSEKIHNPLFKVLFFIVRPILGWLLQQVRQRLLFVATILEDSPSVQNEVRIDEKGQVEIIYQVSTKDESLLKDFRKQIQKYIGQYFQLKLLQAHENERIAHACGTCRMGLHRSNSVVNMMGQSHDLHNLWIVDASVFPSSGSVNPSLTIAANALRTADMALQLESQNGSYQNKKEKINVNIF